MKAKARMKLIVRIGWSPVRAEALCAVSLVTDNQWLFPDVCSKTENGFVAWENCFVGTRRRNIRAEKLNNFSKMILTPGDGVFLMASAATVIRGARPRRFGRLHLSAAIRDGKR